MKRDNKESESCGENGKGGNDTDKNQQSETDQSENENHDDDSDEGCTAWLSKRISFQNKCHFNPVGVKYFD